MLHELRHFLALVRFSHTLFAFPFALLAGVMAWASDGSSFRWRQLVGIIFCMVFARGAAMAFNRIADRHIDAANPRTAGRHLPAGTLRLTQVVAFAVVCSAAFAANTLWFLPNRLPLYLSTPVLLFIFAYSYAKRFTTLTHFWLGAALALAPVAAWIAIRGDVVMHDPSDLLSPIVLGGVVLSWVAGFDVIYACQDAEFDRQSKLRSIPAWLGVEGALRVAATCHCGTVLMLALLPAVYPLFGMVFWVGVGAVAALLVYEHVLVRPDDLARVNLAFFHVNAVISLGLFAVGSLDLWLGAGG